MTDGGGPPARKRRDDQGLHQPLGAYFQTEPHFQVPAVTAFFEDRAPAEQAAKDLQAMGFDDVRVDHVERYPTERGDMTGQPFPQSLTDQPDRDIRAPRSADPALGGMSAPDLAGETPYLLTVVLPREGDRDRALSIIRHHRVSKHNQHRPGARPDRT